MEAIAARVGISHPRIVQMFGTKRDLFLDVLQAVFNRIETAFATAQPTLTGLGDAYRDLLHSEHTTGLVMMQGYAAAADETVRDGVKQRQLQLQLQEAVSRLTGADGMQVRTFFATGWCSQSPRCSSYPSGAPMRHGAHGSSTVQLPPTAACEDGRAEVV